jgi:hypothetical protein
MSLILSACASFVIFGRLHSFCFRSCMILRSLTWRINILLVFHIGRFSFSLSYAHRFFAFNSIMAPSRRSARAYQYDQNLASRIEAAPPSLFPCRRCARLGQTCHRSAASSRCATCVRSRRNCVIIRSSQVGSVRRELCFLRRRLDSVSSSLRVSVVGG